MGDVSIDFKSKAIILSLLLCFFLMVSSVCASDLNETTIDAADSNTIADEKVSHVEKIKSNSNTNNSLSNNDDVLSSDDNYRSLSDLGTLIKITPYSLVLQDNFQYDGTPLVINKNNFVIDFNNHILNANGNSGTVLSITGKNVTIKNMNFINAKGTSTSSKMTWQKYTYTRYTASVYPIVWEGEDGIFDNCNVHNCEIVMKWTGDNGLINNSNFHNSLYEQILCEGYDFKLLNSNIVDINGFSGSEYTTGHIGFGVQIRNLALIKNCNFKINSNGVLTYGDVLNCNFTDSRAPLEVHSGVVSQCIFDRCSNRANAVEERYFNTYIIYLREGSVLEHCIVKNCKSNVYVYEGYHKYVMISLQNDCEVRDCDFINNTAGGLFTSSAQKGIQRCNIINNTFTSYLFMIVNNGRNPLAEFSNVYMDSCNFINNKFDVGYIIDTSGVIRIYNCNFVNNTASTTCLRVNSGKLIVQNSSFTTNTEKDGWAIYLKDQTMHLIVDENTVFNNVTHRAINLLNWDDSSFNHVYVNQTGGGTGLTKDSPTSWNLAIATVDAYGIIEFVNNGRLYDSFTAALTIDKPITVVGSGVTIIGHNHGIFFVSSDNVAIRDFILRDSISGYAAILGITNNLIATHGLYVTNCTFINNVGSDCGAIATKGTTKYCSHDLYVYNCTFINNTATSYKSVQSDGSTPYHTSQNAGAISAWGSTYIYNSVFDSNHASYAGAVAFTYCDAVVENCTFTNNYATTLLGVGAYGQGGYQTAGAVVMHVVNKMASYVKGCVFENNTAPMAGALYMQGSDKNIRGVLAYGLVNLSDCIFIGNNATTKGGAAYLYSNSAMVNNCTFINNRELSNLYGYGGGAIFLDGSGLKLTDSNFINNGAAGSGSAIKTQNTFKGTLTINNCNFTGNINSTIDLDLQSATIYLCNFNNNVNGAIVASRYDSGQSLAISYSKFTGNKAVNGSAVFSIIPTTISYSSFDANNVSGFGGAVYLVFDNCIVEYSNFTNNIAQEAAGALYILGSDDIIDHCRFIANIANSTTLGGGAIFNSGNNTLIMDSYFTHNNATNLGGAVYVIDGVAYSIDRDTKATYLLNHCINHTGEPSNKNWNNVYDGTAEELLIVVYVVLHPESWYGNDGILSENTGETWEDATSLGYGFSRISPKGTMIFVNASEIHDYTGRTDVTNPFECNKIGLIFIGNNTTISGLKFKINPRATGIEVYNFNFANNDDTAIIWDGNKGVIENCTFYDNGGRYCYKGAAMQILKGDIIIRNCTFINNEVAYENVEINDGGGALFINASDILITDCIFNNNSANNGAHVLLTENSNYVIISNSGFYNGYGIDMYGHAIRVDSLESVQILSCNFTNNTLRDTGYYNGGAILVDGDIVYMLIKNCIFDNNTASSSGGALAFTGFGSMIAVDNNTFINNNVSGYTDINTGIYYSGHFGGAVYVLNGEISFKNNNFTNNHAIFGGAIYNVVSISIEGGCFVLNNASMGGAIYSNGTLNALNVIFIANNATKFGGAIFSNANTNLISCNYSDNYADYGGALYLNGTSNSLNNVYFIKNTASHGSAIYLTAGNKITVRDVDLLHNNVTGFHNHDGKEGPCGDIHVKDDESITILDNSLKLGNIIYPETICINDIYWSDYIYVSNTGNGLGLGADDATSLKEGINHIRPNGKIIFINDEVYLDDLEIKNLNNVTFVGNSTTGQVTFKRNSTNSTNKGLLSIIDSSVNFENIDLEMNLNLTNTTLNINNADIKANITAGDKAELNLNNITVDSSKITINYETGSSGSIVNSSFTNVTGVNHIININGAVDLDNISVTGNNIGGSAVYYGPNGSGNITNSTFVNNTALNGARNINISDSNKVNLVNNTFDVFVSNVNITTQVYGEDVAVNGTFDAGINVAISDIALTFNDTFKTNQTVTVGKNNVFSFNLNGGVLGVGFYNLTAEDKNTKNIYLIKHLDNEVNVVKAVVAANDMVVVEVSYGMNNTIIIKGTFNQTGTRVNYTGVVNVTITNENVTIFNESVKIINGSFSAVLLDQGRLSAGKYDVIVSNNGLSNNDNYTVVNTTFKNNLTVSKTVVGANSITNITVVYGMNDTITVFGTFNSSAYVIGGFARNYTGEILVSITGPNGNINNTVQVINGKFTIVLNDSGRLAAGIYDIAVTTTENSVNANYTMKNTTFKNNATVLKAAVGANYTSNVTVIYGMNGDITFEGTFNSSTGNHAIKYNGNVTVMISSGKYSFNHLIFVKDGKFNATFVDNGHFGVGSYNITVNANEFSLNDNYTVVDKTFANKLEVNKATVGAETIQKITVIYGMNNTIIVRGEFNASLALHADPYDGIVTVTISNGNYSITNTSSLNENYTVCNVTFINNLTVNKADVVGQVNEIVVVYGVNDTITIFGNVTNTTYGVKYNGLVNITIPGTGLVALNVPVRDGKFTTTIVDKGNLTVGKYNISISSNYINANYTFVDSVSVNNISVVNFNVTASDLVNVTVVYGVNKTVNISGNVSNAPFGVKYNGLINITITNGVKSVNALNVRVINGVFNVNIEDMGNLTPGKYNVALY